MLTFKQLSFLIADGEKSAIYKNLEKKMNITFKQTALAVLLSSMLAACGSDDDGNNNESKIGQITTDTPTLQYLEVKESDEVFTVDLLTGLNNPANTNMTVVSFGDKVLDENGEPILNDLGNPDTSIVPYIRQLGAGTDKHVVFDREQGGLELKLTENQLKVQPFVWTDELAYGEVAHFKLQYFVDNGYDNGDDDFDNDLFERWVEIKVTGVEDPVETVEINAQDNFEAPIGYDIAISATVMPANATFKELTWKSADESIATVTQIEGEGQKAYVSGLTTGTVEISATSKSGEIVDTVIANVVAQPSGPVEVAIKVAGEDKNQINLEMDEYLQLDAVIDPDNLPADKNNLIWTTANDSVVTVDEAGKIYGAQAGASTTVRVTTETSGRNDDLTVNVVPSSNLWFGANLRFETGDYSGWELFTYEDAHLGTVITVSEQAAYSRDYGIEIDTTNSTGNPTLVLKADEMPQAIILADKKYKLSYWLNRTTGGSGWTGNYMDITTNAGGYQQLGGQNWYDMKLGWKKYEFEFDGKNWPQSGTTLNIRFPKGHIFYLDDVRFEDITPATETEE